MQVQIEKLVNRLREKYPTFSYYREGPCHCNIKFDVLLKNNEEGLYIKAFTDSEEGRVHYKKEIQWIEIFNKFSRDQKLDFLGPEIVEKYDDGLFFVMKDIEFYGKKLINFRKLEKNVVMEHFYRYRKVFDKFETYCIENGYKLIDTSDGYSVEQLIEKCKQWYFKGEKIVEKNGILIPFSVIESKIIELYDKCGKMLLLKELSFKWFWTGHVFEGNDCYQLVDFDIIGYETKGKSLCRLACYCVILSVDNYAEYQKRKSDFERWRQRMLEMNERELVDILILTSLVGILYADYAGNMITQDYNRKLVNGKGVTPEENAEKGTKRCAKLLEEWYDIK